MSKPKELPFSKQDVIRAFKILAGPDDPEGLITPETLEKALVCVIWGLVSYSS
jgi:hypothetical protein